jgi:hypothetical protein
MVHRNGCLIFNEGYSMQPSSIFCRAQEARQHAVAMSSELANTRGIATIAAAAWAKEALAAEKREERFVRKSLSEGAALPLGPLSRDDRSFSENPDRGFAEADLIAG